MYKYNYFYTIINLLILFLLFLITGFYYLNKNKEYSILFFLLSFISFISLLVCCSDRRINNKYEELV